MKIKLVDCFTERSPYLNKFKLGENDLALLLRLIKRDQAMNKKGRDRFGSDYVDSHPHSKVLRLFNNVYAIPPFNGAIDKIYHTINSMRKKQTDSDSIIICELKDMIEHPTFSNTFIPKQFIEAMRAAHESYARQDSRFIEKFEIDYRADNSYYFFELDSSLKLLKQFATYGQGTVSLSTSTMYNILKRPLEETDFQNGYRFGEDFQNVERINNIIGTIKQKGNLYQHFHEAFCKHNNIPITIKTFKDLENYITDILPSNYIQKRFIMMNKDALIRMIVQREGHKLKAWKTITQELERCYYEE